MSIFRSRSNKRWKFVKRETHTSGAQKAFLSNGESFFREAEKNDEMILCERRSEKKTIIRLSSTKRQMNGMWNETRILLSDSFQRFFFKLSVKHINFESVSFWIVWNVFWIESFFAWVSLARRQMEIRTKDIVGIPLRSDTNLLPFRPHFTHSFCKTTFTLNEKLGCWHGASKLSWDFCFVC